MAPSGRDHIFVSYSHKDKKFLEDLLKFLTPYNLRIWADPYIKVGDKWEGKIGDALGKAGAAILLVSQDFLVSSYVNGKELPPLLSAGENEGFTLVCVPVSSSTYQPTPLAQFQWIQDPEQPLDLVPKAKRLNIVKLPPNSPNYFPPILLAKRISRKKILPSAFPLNLQSPYCPLLLRLREGEKKKD